MHFYKKLNQTHPKKLGHLPFWLEKKLYTSTLHCCLFRFFQNLFFLLDKVLTTLQNSFLLQTCNWVFPVWTFWMTLDIGGSEETALQTLFTVSWQPCLSSHICSKRHGCCGFKVIPSGQTIIGLWSEKAQTRVDTLQETCHTRLLNLLLCPAFPKPLHPPEKFWTK